MSSPKHPDARFHGSLIPWWLGALVVAIIAVAIVALSGCASLDYDWQRTRPAAPKPWATVYVADVDAACRAVNARTTQGERILGCAQYRADGCTIFLPHGAPAWIAEHEAHHCDGFTHN